MEKWQQRTGGNFVDVRFAASLSTGIWQAFYCPWSVRQPNSLREIAAGLAWAGPSLTPACGLTAAGWRRFEGDTKENCGNHGGEGTSEDRFSDFLFAIPSSARTPPGAAPKQGKERAGRRRAG
jgi:hypothetical protein